jgi:carbon monoxide dehydrogenase subunit G
VKLEHSFTVPADLETVWQAVLDPERVAPCMPGATLSEVDGDAFKGSVKVKLGPISLLYKGSGEFLEKDESSRKVVIKASGKDARGNGTAAATVTVTLRADGSSSTAGAVVTDLSITGKPAQFGRGLISEVGGKILDTFANCLASKLAPPEEGPPNLSVVKEEKAATKEPKESGDRAGESGGKAGEKAEKQEARQEKAKGQAEGAKAKTAAEPSAERAVASAAQSMATSAATAHAEARATGRKAGEATASNAPAATKPRLAAAPEPETEPIDLLSYAGPSVLKRVAPLLALVAAVLVFITLRRRNR